MIYRQSMYYLYAVLSVKVWYTIIMIMNIEWDVQYVSFCITGFFFFFVRRLGSPNPANELTNLPSPYLKVFPFLDWSEPQLRFVPQNLKTKQNKKQTNTNKQTKQRKTKNNFTSVLTTLGLQLCQKAFIYFNFHASNTMSWWVNSCLWGSLASVEFFSKTPSHLTSSQWWLVGDGNWKFLGSPIKNLEEKPCILHFFGGNCNPYP